MFHRKSSSSKEKEKQKQNKDNFQRIKEAKLQRAKNEANQKGGTNGNINDEASKIDLHMKIPKVIRDNHYITGKGKIPISRIFSNLNATRGNIEKLFKYTVFKVKYFGS